MTIALLTIAALAACALAFANGANDNSKGVATLIGCGLLRPRTALLFATAMTFLGSIAATFLAGTLLATFSGAGIVPEAIAGSGAFPASVGLAAAATVLLATRLGIPVSTTHALLGAMIGIGLAGEVFWPALWSKFAWPLLASPALAVILTVPLYRTLRWTRLRCGIDRRSCVCFQAGQPALAAAASGPAPGPGPGPGPGPALQQVAISAGRRVRHGHRPECTAGLHGRIVGLDAQLVLDGSHLFTAGAVSFARGLNDTPKIAAILLGAGAIARASGAAVSPVACAVAVGVGIALGGLLAARRVALTMGHRITEMNDGQGFTANFVTAVLVIFASRLGAPVSTTHVSCGSLAGIGLANGTARWPMIGTIALAWVTTLPLAGGLGWLLWTLLG